MPNARLAQREPEREKRGQRDHDRKTARPATGSRTAPAARRRCRRRSGRRSARARGPGRCRACRASRRTAEGRASTTRTPFATPNASPTPTAAARRHRQRMPVHQHRRQHDAARLSTAPIDRSRPSLMMMSVIGSASSSRIDRLHADVQDVRAAVAKPVAEDAAKHDQQDDEQVAGAWDHLSTAWCIAMRRMFCSRVSSVARAARRRSSCRA